MREATRKFGPFPTSLIFGVCLAILGAKFWLIQNYGSDLPFANAGGLRTGSLALGPIQVGDIVQSRDGDHIDFGRMLAQLVFSLNGQWDARLLMVINAVLHSITIGCLLFVLRKQLSEIRFFGVALLCAFLFGLPISWE